VKTRALKFFSLLVIFLLGYSFFGLSVSNQLSKEDIISIESLKASEVCSKVNMSYKDEIDCIKYIQFKIQEIGTTQCASKEDIIEPGHFLKRNYGCCFDRARFIEKAARYYNFKTRHVFIIKPKISSLLNLFPLNQSSHAASEVLTQKGWLGVDSNEPFIILDQDQNPVTYKAALNTDINHSKMFPETLFSGDIDIIYGLYSRHGFFHAPKIPGPEFAFSEFLHNFFDYKDLP